MTHSVRYIAKKPYQTIWGFIPIVFLLAILNSNNTIDLNWQDTYFVIPYLHFGCFLLLILGGTGLLYWLFRRRKLTHWMTMLHVLITIFVFFWLMAESYLLKFIPVDDFYKLALFHKVSSILYLAMFFGQLFFLANLMISLRRK